MTTHTWTSLIEYATTKDPDKLWVVQRNEAGEYKCVPAVQEYNGRVAVKSGLCPAFTFNPTCCREDRNGQAGVCGTRMVKDGHHWRCPIHGTDFVRGCKHVLHYLQHPEQAKPQNLKASDPFGMALRHAFERRFAGLVALPPRYTPVVVAKLPLEHREAWRAFVDDVRLLMPTATMPLPMPETTTTTLGLRRIILD